MTAFSCVVVGHGALLIGCCDGLLDNGHEIRVVISKDPNVLEWAANRGVLVRGTLSDLTARFENWAFDWLFDINNVKRIPDAILALPKWGSIKFHNGPLPQYAGLNAPSWALQNREIRFGVTWHMITLGTDRGDIVAKVEFDIAEDETAFSLNIKCFSNGLKSFSGLLSQLENNGLHRRAQESTNRQYFSRTRRPDAAGRLNFSSDAKEISALVRSLNFGLLWNPITCAKIEANGKVLMVRNARAIDTVPHVPVGTILQRDSDSLVVATHESTLHLSGFSDSQGQAIDLTKLIDTGDILPSPDTRLCEELNTCMQSSLTGENHWRIALQNMTPVDVPLAGPKQSDSDWTSIAVDLDKWLIGSATTAAVMAWALKCSGQDQADLAISSGAMKRAGQALPGYVSEWVPMKVRSSDTRTKIVSQLERNLDRMQTCGGFLCDLIARDPQISETRVPSIGIALGNSTPITGTILTVSLKGDYRATLFYDRTRISDVDADMLSSRLEHCAA